MTKKGILFISVLACMLALPMALNAQCKQFAKNTCKAGLETYQHDGNYRSHDKGFNFIFGNYFLT